MPAEKQATMANDKARPGDWTCPGCGDLQFARNQACRRCGVAKPTLQSMGQAAATFYPGGVGAGSPNGQEMKSGDWICPNCGDLVFARNSHCRRCDTARPDFEPARLPWLPWLSRLSGVLPLVAGLPAAET
ncbi:unnamed protein product [Effrenium voratum]|uniref:RanBP2-type domain-containing protein n=1 Tax=Effrenium voratum TaxID=2562239 RepID=A0AA36JSE7_9DINO|nr:unnamed protein product [Effrenium voratum]CAJ1410864.1 unnamed protein product [Effrenium voratum]CAJ1452685.1 unnamed protein product [Effrenium voratum]